MSYIADKNLYKAVMFARKMIKNGQPAIEAIRISSKYYFVSASYIGKELNKLKQYKYSGGEDDNNS